MNTTNSGRLTYKEACTVGSATAAAVAATAAAVARAPVGATKEVLDKLDKANAAAEVEANLQVARAEKKSKRKVKKLEEQAAIEKGKRKEAKQKRRAEKTREAEEEQARVESARKVRREAKRAKREEAREEKRASADSAVVAVLQYDALDDELVKSLDADGDDFAQRYATAAEADANSAAEANSKVESEAEEVEASFESFGCRTCGYSGGTQCDCAYYEDFSADNGEGGGACGGGEGAGDACDGSVASSGSGSSGGLQVGGYGCGWQPGAHCNLSDLDSEAEMQEAERCGDAEAERAWRLAREAQPKGRGSVEQSVVKLEDINGTAAAAKKRSVDVGIYETGQRETKFLRRSDNRGSNARRASAITGELNAVAMPALSIAPVAAAAATPAATPHENAAHELLNLMFAAPEAGGGIGGGGNVGGGDGGGGGGDGGGADDTSNDGDGDFDGHGAAASPLQQFPIERPFGVASEAEARAAQEQADPGLLVAAQEQAVAEALRERQAAAAEVLHERQAAAQQQVLEEERVARRAQVAAQVAAAQAARGDAGEEPLVMVAHGTRVWTEKQRLALALFGEGRSLALLGFAGTGKTVRASTAYKANVCMV